jgi:hypothetical protein
MTGNDWPKVDQTEIDRTEIEMQYLSPIVLADEASSLRDILAGFREIDETARRGSVVVISMGDGTFETFTYLDLFQHLADDESIAQLPFMELLGRVGAVASDTAPRIGISLGDAHDLRIVAPGDRLVVLEDATPVGVLIDPPMGGGGEGVQRLEERIFEPQAAMANGDDAEPPEDADHAPRFLSAKVHADGEQRKRAFKAGAVNELSVFIAPADRDYIQSDEEFTHEVAEGEVHTLDVFVWAPGLIDPPLRGQFDAPHAGSSVEPASFEVPVPAALERVEINIEVLYRGRMLQGATLTGITFAGTDADAPADGAIKFQRTARSGLDPAATRPFDATVIVSDETVLIALGGSPVELNLSGIKKAADKIAGRLYTSAVQGAYEAQDGVPGAAVRSLLTFLAYQGHAIHEALIGAKPELAAARTIEVTLRDAGVFFPIEFVYERGTPGPNPALCPNWGDAFQAGETECPGCPAAGDDAPYVCPLGFWALSREIARRIDPIVSDDVARSAVASNPSVSNPRLARLVDAVIGASTKVDAADEPTSQIGETVNVAVELLGVDNVQRVEDWPGWVTAVQERGPSLLLAMSHTEMDDEIGAEVLQIGASSNLRSLSIGGQHVQLPVGTVGPIVLLLGCTTSNQEIGYLGFVPAFLNHHAAVVVGTVAKVLGRQTGPVARQFLRAAFLAQGKDVTLGEVMRRTRGEMLLANNAMGMTLTAYGNSDWLLAAES